jgi:hypothetical protein
VRVLARRLAEGAPAAVTARPAGSTGTPAGRLPHGAVDAYPLTATQHRMIEATRSDPAQSAYHDVFAYTVALPLDEPLLRACLRRMTASCETLRTAFDLDASPAPRQLVHDSVEPGLTVVDAVGDTAAADAWFEAERGSEFAWDQPGLIRFAAHRTALDRFVLSMGFHHAIIDGWSLSLLIRDLLVSYAAELGAASHAGQPPAQGRPAGTFADYVMAEAAARASAESQQFWRDVLAGHPGTALPRYLPAGGARWAETTVTVPPGQEDRLREVARATGHPLKHLLLAAHLRVLNLVTGEPDVITGVFTHGRPETDDAEKLTGMFLNFQPHRVRIGEQRWPQLVEEVFAFEMRALPHRRCAATSADGGGHDGWPRYPALFNYTDFPAYADVAHDGGHLTGVRWFEHTDAPFLANVGRDPAGATLEITLNADGRLLPQEPLEDLARLYTAVLAQITRTPDGRVQDPTDEIRACVDALGARQRPSV